MNRNSNLKTFTAVNRGLTLSCIIAGAIICFIWWRMMPQLGDDLLFACDYEARGATPAALPGQMAGVWQGCNARMGDLLNTIWLAALPGVLTAIIAAAMIPLMILTMMRLAGCPVRSPLYPALMLAAITWMLPWWDMTHFVCFFNYPWGQALIGLALCLFFQCRMRSRWWILLLPLPFVAAATHEALGAPLVAGFALWLLFDKNRPNLRGIKLCWLGAMILGGLFTLTSPASWQRLAASGEADASPLQLLLNTLPIVVCLLLAVIILALVRPARLKELCRSRWLLYAAIALFSAVFALAAGVEGRSGWFAQSFALIALTGLCLKIYPAERANGLTALLSLALLIMTVAGISCHSITGLQKADRLSAAVALYPQNPTATEQLLRQESADPWDIATLPALTTRRRPAAPSIQEPEHP